MKGVSALKTEKHLTTDEQDAFIGILASLAGIEGEINIDEIDFLMSVTEQWGIPAADVERVLATPRETAIEVPKDAEERYEELAALIGMMMVDGEIYGEEYEFCELVADKFGIDPAIINDIVADILESDV